MVGTYNIYDAYKVINDSITDVTNNITRLNPVKAEKSVLQYRLKEEYIDVSIRIIRVTDVVVGHNLSQYVNRFYSIRLQENERCLLDILVDINNSNITLAEFGGELCSYAE